MIKKQVFIIEDHAAIRLNLKVFFEGEGLEVVLVNNGQEALDLLKLETNFTPCLILTDLRMPVMDGIRFLLELKRNYLEIFTHTPIFMMSAGTDSDFIGIKTTGILKKPFNLDELYKIVEIYCR